MLTGPMPTLNSMKGQSKKLLIPGICVIDNKFKFCYKKSISDMCHEENYQELCICGT